MVTIIIIAILVVAFVVGGILKLRSTTRTGMPSQDVLDRATQRAKELDAAEKREDKGRGDF